MNMTANANLGQPLSANTELPFPLETLRAHAQNLNIPHYANLNDGELMAALTTSLFQKTIAHQGQLDGMTNQITGHQGQLDGMTNQITGHQGQVSQIVGQVQDLEGQMRAMSRNFYIYGFGGLLLAAGLPMVVSILANQYFSSQIPIEATAPQFNATQFILSQEEEEELLASLR
jgi:hypothetical protein